MSNEDHEDELNPEVLSPEETERRFAELAKKIQIITQRGLPAQQELDAIKALLINFSLNGGLGDNIIIDTEKVLARVKGKVDSALKILEEPIKLQTISDKEKAEITENLIKKGMSLEDITNILMMIDRLNKETEAIITEGRTKTMNEILKRLESYGIRLVRDFSEFIGRQFTALQIEDNEYEIEKKSGIDKPYGTIVGVKRLPLADNRGNMLQTGIFIIAS